MCCFGGHSLIQTSRVHVQGTMHIIRVVRGPLGSPYTPRFQVGFRTARLRWASKIVGVTVLLASAFSILTRAISKMHLSVCQDVHVKMSD